MTRPKRLKRMSMGRKTLIAREAVDWIIALESRRRPVPMPQDRSSNQRRRLIEMERNQHRLKFQAYDVVLALKQIYDLVSHLRGRRIPKYLKAPLDAFLTAMEADDLKNLRDAFVHYDEFIAGTMRGARLAAKLGTWDEHKSERPDRAAWIAGSKKNFTSMRQGFGARFNLDTGVTDVILMGRTYHFMDACNAAVALGPPLARWGGRLWFRLDEAQEEA